MHQKSCAFHPPQTLSNFCRSPQCLLPMCPACIKIHSAEHARSNTHGDYDCIADMHTEIQTDLENTIKQLIAHGITLKQLHKNKQQQKQLTLSHLATLRTQLIALINKYIDGLQKDIITTMQYFSNNYQEQLLLIDTDINKISMEASNQLYNLNNQKQMKAIIHHISANMSQYYRFQLSQISQKIKDIKIGVQTSEKQLNGIQINSALKCIGECYQSIFVQPGKRKQEKNVILHNSSSSKNSKECFTESSLKKM